LYKKSKTWFGFHQAKDAIKQLNKVYVCEGYFDVISMHKAGVENIICSCGTAITDAQVQFLIRYTKNVALLMDGDDPGIDAATKNIDLFLAYGCKVTVAILPDGQDPDEWARSIVQENLIIEPKIND